MTPLPERWSLAGNHRRNGAVNLVYGSGEVQIRAVHTFPSGCTPLAGHNKARRAYYTNQALAEFNDPDHMPTHRLLLLWEELGVEEPFDLQIVRPLGPGRIGRHVRSDMSFPLPRVRTAFENLEFETLDDVETLDVHELDDDDVINDDD